MNTKKHENLLYKELSYQIQGAAIEVRKNFGPGFKENIYQNAFAEELKLRNIKFEKEKSIQIFSPKTGKFVGSYRPDFIVEGKILVELKAVEKIPKMFINQLYSYLRNSKYELGYFINFVSPKLYTKRVIFTNDRKPFLKNFLVSLSLIFVLFSVLPLMGHAAEIFLNSKNQEIRIDEQFEVSIFLNTEEKNINALEGKIMFPSDLLELKEIRDGNSMINFWIERPEVNPDPVPEQARYGASNKIIFSGITPGGYAGDQGLIFSMIFQSKKEKEGVIEIYDTRALLNDGKGTEAKLKISNLQFLISKEAPAKAPVPEIKDTDLPELFKPEIARDPNIFNGKWFLVFATQDKGSGIDYYEVREGKKNFIVAKSPYLLKNQNLDTEITVKAIDKADNERIVVLPPQNPSRYKNYLIFVIIGGVILIYLIWQILRKFFKPKSKLGAGQKNK